MNETQAPATSLQIISDPTSRWSSRALRNYGDLVAELLIDRLFETPPSGLLRVGGSCLSKALAPASLPADGRLLLWGCGAQDEAGMGDDVRAQVEISSVRGPLTRSVLRLGQAVPIGDPTLLLPLLHIPGEAKPVHPQALLVPQFGDRRSDEMLCTSTGCDAVLRPDLHDTASAAVNFINAILRARFVLTGSLDAAMTATAYGVPFAFWNAGSTDLPFAWRDFAASVLIPCEFHDHLSVAEAWYSSVAAPTLSLPPMWPMLAVAPPPVRPDLLIEAIRRDVSLHGPEILDTIPVPQRHEHDLLRQRQAERRFRADIQDTVQEAFFEHEPNFQGSDAAFDETVIDRLLRAGRHQRDLQTSLGKTQDTVAALRAELAQLRAAAASKGSAPGPVSDFEVRKLEVFFDRQDRHIGALDRKLLTQALQIELLQKDAAAAVPADGTALQLHSTEQRLQALQAEYDEVLRSAIWRVGRRVRGVTLRHPHAASRARRVLKLGWWIVSLRLANRLRQRRQLRHSIELLSRTLLFDPAWYRARHAAFVAPETNPLLHYIWIGARSGLDPHPLFDTSWYISQMPAGSLENPLVHYLTAPEAHDPHPLFDTRHYLSSIEAAIPSGLTPLEHFILQGSSAASPNPIFDPPVYLLEYSEAAAAPGGALLHYLEHGEAAGLAPHPLFDPRWYAERNPDCGDLGPLGHYLHHGRTAGLACSAAMEMLGAVALPLHLTFPSTEAPEISIVVPTYGHLHETYRCLAAIMLKTGSLSYEVIVADDRPDSPIAPALKGDNLHVQVNVENLGFLRSCNGAAKHARGRLLVFLNNDTMVRQDWLRPMAALVEADRRVGMVGCKLLNTDGTVQEAGGIIHSNGWGFPYGAGDDAALGAYNYVREVDVVTGACFLVRRDLFERLGGFDDRFAPAFYEEFDLATALRDLGYKVLYQPASEVVHHGSASYGIETRDRQSKKNHGKFCAKWRTLLATQPVEGDPLFLTRERPAPRGVILVIDDKVPEYDKHAGAVTLFQYLELMCELGLKVVFHPQDAQPLQPYTDALQRLGIEVLHAPETLDGWLSRNGRHLDYVWTARPYVTFPILDLIKRNTGAPILYYTHDLHYLREMRRHELDGSVWALEESLRLKPMELGIFAAVDRVMTPSAEEARIINAELPDAHVTVVPPYLFDDGAVESGPFDFTSKSELLFVGGFDHTPNVDAALWLVNEIMPLVWARRPDARVMIVGNAPPVEVRALAGSRVDVTGFVPTLEPYYGRARISVSPLRYGAGVKGKIVGALQAGVPVITTGCGNEGIQLQHGKEALIGETAFEIANAIVVLLEDEAVCQDLAVAGAEVVRKRFSAGLARSVLLGLLGDELCPVCGTRPRNPRTARETDWREAFSCMTCLSLNRSAALAQVLVAPFRRHRVGSLHEALPLLETLRIHEFSIIGPVAHELSALSSFSCSEFYDAVPTGARAPDGMLCQDIQDLSFHDDSIDLLISQDVMEHVPDPERGFAELFRVLRPGGRHVFTIPYLSSRSATLQRAVMEDGVLRHLLPPEYHGDPLRADGALVFSEYGSDLPGRLRDIGFVVKIHSVGSSRDPQRRVIVFETSKPVR